MLNQTQLQQLQQYVDSGDAIGYYNALIDYSVDYGHLGLGAASDGDSGNAWADFGGIFANRFLEAKFYEAHGREMLESEKQAVREGLIAADFTYRLDGSVTGEDIKNYHHEVFKNLGIPESAWTGTFFDKRLGPFSWCWGCGPEEMANTNFDQMVGQFVENLVTDFGPTSQELVTFINDVMLGEVASNTFKEWGESQAMQLGDIKFEDTASPLWATTWYTLNRIPSFTLENQSLLFEKMWGINDAISSSINGLFLGALNDLIIRMDPLVLDLDGDGIETTPADGSVLFDHTADGTKHATGWISSDDGILVYDRNQNGLIDNGRELFGDNTIKINGELASNGFDALADFDSNDDGKISANDELYSALSIWQDLNSDGVSQPSELSSLSQADVASISLSSEETDFVDDSGNQTIARGHFTRSSGQTGVTGAAAALNLADNKFFREFSEALPIPAELAELPEAKGSGAVRDLKEAATLSSELATFLSDFDNANTGNQQAIIIDGLLQAWANTSDLQNSFELVDENYNIEELRVLAPGQSISDYLDYNRHVVQGEPGKTEEELRDLTAKHEYRLSLTKAISVLEIFNGESMLEIRNGDPKVSTDLYTRSGSKITVVNEGGIGERVRNVAIIQPSNVSAQGLLEAYEQLKQSAYSSLALQTRLKSYLDDISMTMGASGLEIDFSNLKNRLDVLRSSSAQSAFEDLIDLHRILGPRLTLAGWNTEQQLETWFSQGQSDPSLMASLSASGFIFDGALQSGTAGMDVLWSQQFDTEFDAGAGNDLLFGNIGNDKLSGGTGDDKVSGGDGDDVIRGGSGNDILSGGPGVDTLLGEVGDDTLSGGAGDGDLLSGGYGNDRYLITAGEGNKLINNYSADDGIDSLVFDSSVAPEGVVVRRNNNDILLTIEQTGETVTIEYALNFGNANIIDQVVFDNGTVWNFEELKLKAIEGTENSDIIDGFESHDNIQGFGGNDRLNGREGDDILNGGAGTDFIVGGDGDDILRGGTGDNDVLTGNAGSDTYLFAPGEGHTQINNIDGGPQDTLVFEAGIIPAGVSVSRQSEDMLLTIQSTGEVITLSSFFFHTGDYELARVVFHDGTQWDTEYLKQAAISGTENSDTLIGYSTDDIINGLGGNDTITGHDGNDTLDGGAGNDSLNGGRGNDTLFGGEGTDNLVGGDGDDILSGGRGVNDVLTGNAGADTYRFSLGDSDTKVNNISGGPEDTLEFAEGIASSDVAVSKTSQDMLLTIQSTGEVITLSHFFFYTGDYELAKVTFFDGTVWDTDDLKQALMSGTENNDNLSGSDANDVINGFGGNDVIKGNDGDDTLDGGAGNDNLSGGRGNDTLLGGDGTDNLVGGDGDDILSGGRGVNDVLTGNAGADTYRFNLGDNNTKINNISGGSEDMLEFAEGIAPSDVAVSKSNQDMLLTIQSTGEVITLSYFFFYTGDYELAKVTFFDGTVWDTDDLKQALMSGTENNDNLSGSDANDVINGLGGNDVIKGNDGDDTLDGGAGNDSLNGGRGNDTLFGGDGTDNLLGGDGDDVLSGGRGSNDVLTGNAGADTYRFSLGDGNTKVNNISGSVGDTLEFMSGISPEDVAVSKFNQDLLLTVGSSGEVVTLSYFYFYTGDYELDQVKFSDGTVWTTEDLKSFALVSDADSASFFETKKLAAEQNIAKLVSDINFFGGENEIDTTIKYENQSDAEITITSA